MDYCHYPCIGCYEYAQTSLGLAKKDFMKRKNLLEEFRGKQIMVVGMARTGLATVRFLVKEGFSVIANDIRSPESLPLTIKECQRLGVKFVLGEHPLSAFRESDLIVVSPGVPLSIPPLEEARKTGRMVVSEIEMASWVCPSRIIAVTGTNGKSTTVSLIGAMLQQGGRRAVVAGNIGFPLIGVMDMKPLPEVVVCEVSSFQLEGVKNFRPVAGILLNLSPDHLDRYSSFEAYCDTKFNLFQAQEEGDWAILNADDSSVQRIAPILKGKKIYFSRKQEFTPGAFFADDTIICSFPGQDQGKISLEGIQLKGVHNLENLMAAVLSAKSEGLSDEIIRNAILLFQGLEHRTELVREIDGVQFFNDSKGTNIGAVEKALESFTSSLILLMGGRDKGTDFRPLGPLVRERAKLLLCFGEARQKIAQALSGEAVTIAEESMEKAVKTAWEKACPGDVVLLSPGCTSFDQFENFEHRGRVFKSLVDGLASRCQNQNRG